MKEKGWTAAKATPAKATTPAKAKFNLSDAEVKKVAAELRDKKVTMSGLKERYTRISVMAKGQRYNSDLLEAVELELRRRRFGGVVRLEVSSDMSGEMRERLEVGLGIEHDQASTIEGLMDLADLREYQPGDDIRYIDWNVTARMDTPYVRQYTEE